MQKVEGSSPFSRSEESPAKNGGFGLGRGGRRTPATGHGSLREAIVPQPSGDLGLFDDRSCVEPILAGGISKVLIPVPAIPLDPQVIRSRSRVAGAVARPGSHRTVRTLVVYGSSGRRVVNPAAGRFATSNHPHSASCGDWGATMCMDAWRCISTRATSPRSRKNARFRPWSTAGMWLSAHQDRRP